MKISKAVLITGCSTGIGRATAARLAENGWTVYATARKPETLSELEAAGCKTLALDVNDEASMQTAIDTVVAAEGAVGVLINNAGYSQSGALESVPLDKVRGQFETNVFGLIRMSQLALPGMREQGWGKIVNISSIGGKVVFPGGGVYHATKHAVEALSDAMRWEVKGFGVDVIIIEPGLIRTEFANTVAAEIPDDGGPYAEFNREVSEKTVGAYDDGPLGKLGGGPESVAKAIEKAINRKRPRARYSVTPSAKVVLSQGALLSDRAWDAVMRSQFTAPGKR